MTGQALADQLVAGQRQAIDCLAPVDTEHQNRITNRCRSRRSQYYESNYDFRKVAKYYANSTGIVTDNPTLILEIEVDNPTQMLEIEEVAVVQ